MIKCQKCGETKEESEFGKDNRHKSGKTAQCKECRNEYDKENRKRKADNMIPLPCGTSIKCTKCHELKPLEEFGKDKSRFNGKNPWCKLCIEKYSKETYKRKCEEKASYIGPLPLCKCGCGEIVSIDVYSGLPNTYIDGHAWNDRNHTEESNQKNRESNSGEKSARFGKPAANRGIPNSDETNQLISDAMTGEKNPMYGRTGEEGGNWQGGISFEPYGPEFNERLKEFIRTRDNHRCQECFRHQNELTTKLPVHHIDYNKKNNDPSNLISLCDSCHGQTGYSREDWTEYFNNRQV